MKEKKYMTVTDTHQKEFDSKCQFLMNSGWESYGYTTVIPDANTGHSMYCQTFIKE